MKTGKIYILQLQSGNYYVGSTTDVNRRWAQHTAGTGAAECKRDKPVSTIHEFNTLLTENKLVLYIEDMITLSIMLELGASKVTGGRYLTTDYKRAKSDWIEAEYKRIVEAYEHSEYLTQDIRNKIAKAVAVVK